MKNFILFILLLVAAVSILLLVRFNKENGDVNKILEQERYGRMSAEEELQKGEYRVKRLEADLQTTQVKMSRNQEGLDKCKDENEVLKSQIEHTAQQGRSLEDDLRKALDAADRKRSDLESKLRSTEDALRDTRNELGQAKEQLQMAERKAEQQAAAAAAMAAASRK